MTDAQDIVSTLIDGKLYSGWTNVRIDAGIDRVAREFSINWTSTFKDAGSSFRKICGGGVACEVFIGEDKVLTGYVDSTPVQYDAVSYTLGINGRSKTADLCDCSVADRPGQWLNQRLEKIATSMAAPYGISVVTEVNTGAAISDHQTQQGESVFESLDRLLKARQVLATDNAAGNLVIAKPGVKRATTALEYGKNILRGDHYGDWRDRFSTYVMKGQIAGSDAVHGVDASEKKGVAKDSGVKRYRYLVIVQSGQGDTEACANRAVYERDRRAAKTDGVTYKVNGWRQQDGSLWQHNALVYVKDPIMGLDRDMLITETSFQIDSEGGMVAYLQLLPLEAYSVAA